MYALTESRRVGTGSNPTRLRIGLFGCPLDTGNSGVTALALATVRGLSRPGIPIDLTIFDHGRGERVTRLPIDNGQMDVRQVGCYSSRRFYRLSNLTQIHVAAHLGLRHLHPILSIVGELDAVLDISGGDSFSDIYGIRQFRAQCLPKLIALQLGLPLVLLPQTFGPYKLATAQSAARSILRRASQVWTRDARSYEVARTLLNGTGESDRLHRGIDTAFGLPARTPRDARTTDAVLEFKAGSDLLVGLNISGLLYNRPGDDTRRFGYRGSYREIVHRVIHMLTEHNGLRVVLVSHVSPPDDTVDCDATACASLLRSLPDRLRGRIFLPPGGLDPSEIKWVIGQCDWFCGARMHSCIAALSQAVPSVGIAYSDKMIGLFEEVGIPDAVVDPRRLGSHESADRIMAGFQERRAVKQSLRDRLPAIRDQLDRQFDVIVSSIS